MPRPDHGVLYIVATPIGNLDDITRRAVSLLEAMDAIAAEDTRHSANLLKHLGITTPVFALHEHNEAAKADAVIARLEKGDSIALISDAGTPLISDPGYVLVNAARQKGIQVVPVPGASSVLAALSCSGLPTDRFAFEGFLPVKQVARCKRLQDVVDDARTLIFFEAPHRLLDCLQDMCTVFGASRRAILARELTKTFETFLDAPLGELTAQVAADANQSRGEIVLVIAGNTETPMLDARNKVLFNLLRKELPMKKAAALAARITGVSKNTYYQFGLEDPQDA
jgi:16S rRNA (cytidine1402-2'-O)-methyltransferase